MNNKIEIEYSENIDEKELKNIDSKKNINKLVEKVLGAALLKENIPSNFFITLNFITDQEINDLNRIHRGIDNITDVLSFPLLNKNDIHKIIEANIEINDNKTNIKDLDTMISVYLDNYWVLGEIFINLEQIKKQSIEYNHSFERELSYILVHSFYHLLGFDHMNDDDKKQMRIKEEELLEELGILRG